MTGEEIAGLVESAALDAAIEPSAGLGAAGAVAVTVTVPAGHWLALLMLARDRLGCDFFDWLSGVDEAGAGVAGAGAAGAGAAGAGVAGAGVAGAGVAVLAHVYSLAGRHHLLLRTVLAGDQPRLPTATGVYRGAAWHERETGEMFGVIFDGHPGPGPLLLPDGFEGHPLRKDFPLAARAAQEWPGAREPGEPASPGPEPRRGRRRAVPPGVPEGWPAG